MIVMDFQAANEREERRRAHYQGKLPGRDTIRIANRRLRVVFRYRMAQPGELTIEPNDIIELMAEFDSGWWLGRCRGEEGLFPHNYVVDE